MLDILIRGGTLVDGTGNPGRAADVGVRGGRVVAVGDCNEAATQTIDAAGLVVAPGFIDLHTHYDAQVFWDPATTPSPLHGVTSIVGGNCGFSIAPLDAAPGDYLMRMLARVEGMPLASLATGVPWDWTSFGEWLDRLEGQLVLNAGFLVGHSALRRVVMGEAAVGETADPTQQREMEALLHESIRAGGLGFSSSQAPTHNDGDGNPVPSRFARREELIGLAGVLRDLPGTALEFLPGVGVFDDERIDLMVEMSLAANRPMNWNVLVPSAFMPETHQAQLRASDVAAERGAKIVALTPSQVMCLRLNFRSGFVLDALPGWSPIVALPLEEKRNALAKREVREELQRGANSDEAGVLRVMAIWENATIDHVQNPKLKAFEGRKVGEIAQEQNKQPFDALLDLALEDDLHTSFMPFIPGDDDANWKLKAEVWRDPRTVIGASDAGAHLDMIDTFTCTTSLLGPAVREKQLLSIEEAVHQLTEIPARLYGIRDRGRIAEGTIADLTLFDPATVGPHPIETRYDLPGGAGRLYAEADGIEHVFVNGTEIVKAGKLTGASPGQTLRSGRDTDSVTVPANAQ